MLNFIAIYSGGYAHVGVFCAIFIHQQQQKIIITINKISIISSEVYPWHYNKFCHIISLVYSVYSADDIYGPFRSTTCCIRSGIVILQISPLVCTQATYIIFSAGWRKKNSLAHTRLNKLASGGAGEESTWSLSYLLSSFLSLLSSSLIRTVHCTHSPTQTWILHNFFLVLLSCLMRISSRRISPLVAILGGNSLIFSPLLYMNQKLAM